MRVGVIAYELEGARSGVGRYLDGLLRGAAEIDGSSIEWQLLFKGDPTEEPLLDLPGVSGLYDRRPSARPIAWEQIRLPRVLRRLELDLLFSPGYSLPIAPALPQVVTLHDLSYEHLRHEFRPREGLRRRLLARWAAKKADRVLVDTHAMAADLARTYRVDAAKIGVVPLAVDRRFFSPTAEAGVLHGLGVRPPYLLCLGSVLPRRRLDLVIRAFADTAPEPTQLVIAGRDRLPESGRLQSWIDASPARDRIARLDYVPETVITALYAGADASIYLSDYEGYGLPPLESLAAGTAALTSPGMALDDLVPDYPYRVELTPDAVGRGLRRLLDDPKRQATVRSARDVLRRLTWKACAERFIDELGSVLNRGTPRG
ncbi:MAG: glycosyltransferase family 1 protein [Acidobacteriota bacterium]